MGSKRWPGAALWAIGHGRIVEAWQMGGVGSSAAAVGLLAVALLLAVRTTARFELVQEHPTGIESKETVAIVFWREFSLKMSDIDEDQLVGCVSKSIRDAHSTLRIVSPDEFRRAVFPDLDPEAAPRSPEYLSLLLSHSVFRERIAALGIRYLIFLSGVTDQSLNKDISEGGCGCGPGGCACFALLVWDRKSRLVASVLDLKEARWAGKVDGSASGHPWLFFVLPFPLAGLPAPTETKACEDLGETLAKFLAGEKMPQAKGVPEGKPRGKEERP